MTTIAQPHDATCRCPQCTMPSGMGVDLYRPAQLRALGVLVPLPPPRTVVAEPRAPFEALDRQVREELDADREVIWREFD